MQVYKLSQSKLLQLENILLALKEKTLQQIEKEPRIPAYLCVTIAELIIEDETAINETRIAMFNLLKQEILDLIGNYCMSISGYLFCRYNKQFTVAEANQYRVFLVNKWLTQTRKQLQRIRKEQQNGKRIR
jgi:hypothetical protein